MKITEPGLGISELQKYGWDNIRKWLEENKGYLQGDVLDYGAGLTPYKYLCKQYTPYDPKYEYNILENKEYDTVLCTQVIQFVDNPIETMNLLKLLIKKGGHLVMTHPASWYEVDSQDTWRITKEGMRRLWGDEIIKHEPITSLEFKNFNINLVYGIIGCNTYKR